MKFFKNPSREMWPELVQRPDLGLLQVKEIVSQIVEEVKQDGESAVLRLTEKLDRWSPESSLSLKVTNMEMIEGTQDVSSELKAAIRMAMRNIEKFHEAQTEPVRIIETMPGIQCWRKSVPIESVGLYIPGGNAPLFSTLLMLAIPAKIAGCREIIVCSPANSGKVHPALLYTASLLGIKSFFKIGGAQAIAAMAYGVAGVPKVDKIFGPGNRYVMLAKQMANSEGVAIDMPAGPSEVAVFADDTARIPFVVSDLLSQAEHGMDSQVMLVTTSSQLFHLIGPEMEKQKETLIRHKETESSLKNSKCMLFENTDDSFEFLNQYAPEHLIIASDKAQELSDKVINAGSVFLGHFSPESAGDYISGTNHTLPTSGFAKAYSGVSLDSFVKKISFQQLTPDGLKSVVNEIGTMALAEGLTAHERAANIRFEK